MIKVILIFSMFILTSCQSNSSIVVLDDPIETVENLRSELDISQEDIDEVGNSILYDDYDNKYIPVSYDHLVYINDSNNVDEIYFQFMYANDVEKVFELLGFEIDDTMSMMIDDPLSNGIYETIQNNVRIKFDDGSISANDGTPYYKLLISFN